MIKFLINLLKRINERIKKKKQNLEVNKNRYWNKLTASERLHYDSRINKINEENSHAFLGITLSMIKIFFYIFGFFLLIKLLFELDASLFILPISSLIKIVPIIFKITITIDFVILFLNEFLTKPNLFKKLNKKYGFKVLN